MLDIFSLLPFFLSGLLAGTHCAGMCGGIVTALSISSSGKTTKYPPLSYLLAYNLGRIGSYMIAGIIVGSVAAGSLMLGKTQILQQALYIVANLTLVAMGLYLAGLWNGVLHLEKAGGILWRKIQPFSRKILPIRSVGQAFILGGLWGWMPCGLVYSILIAAFASGNPTHGAAVMFSFGLGTLPNLLLLGYFTGKLRPWLQKRSVRLTTGCLIIFFGVLGLLKISGLIASHNHGLQCITNLQ